MNDFQDRFSVNRKEYMAFVEQIKPEYRDIRIINDNYITFTKIFSKKTGKCLCSRVSYMPRTEEEEILPEQYYIFEMPDSDERAEPIPKYHLHLETREEVQAFFNAISKMRGQKDD